MQAYHHGFVDILLCHLKSDQQDVSNIFNSKWLCPLEVAVEATRAVSQTKPVRVLYVLVSLRTDVTVRTLLPDRLIVMNIVDALTALAFC